MASNWGWKNTFGGGHLNATDFWQERVEEEGEKRVGGGRDLGGRWRKALSHYIFGISFGYLWDIFKISLSERTSGVPPVIF